MSTLRDGITWAVYLMHDATMVGMDLERRPLPQHEIEAAESLGHTAGRMIETAYRLSDQGCEHAYLRSFIEIGIADGKRMALGARRRGRVKARRILERARGAA